MRTYTHSWPRNVSALRDYFEEHGRGPTADSGDASDYLDLPENTVSFAAIDRFFRSHGSSIERICKTQGFVDSSPLALKDIGTAVQSFIDKHNRYPTVYCGDASPHMGRFRGTFSFKDLDEWLRDHGSSLADACHHVGGSKYRWTEGFSNLAVKGFHCEHGHIPTRDSGDASKYVGMPEGTKSFRSLDGWLKSKGSSVPALCRDLGLESDLTLRACKDALMAFYQEHGRIPTQEEGDASKYLGISRGTRTFRAIDSWLCRHARTSLKGLSKSLGLLDEIPMQACRDAILVYLKSNGDVPDGSSGRIPRVPNLPCDMKTFRDMYYWLEYRNTSLRMLCGEMGVEVARVKEKQRDRLILDAKKAARAFFLRNGKIPSYRSGDASTYLDKKPGTVTFREINNRLKRYETSVFQVAKSMNLKARYRNHKSAMTPHEAAEQWRKDHGFL